MGQSLASSARPRASRLPLPPARFGPLVVISAALLVATAAALAILWAATNERRIETYAVFGGLSHIQLDVRSGSVEIFGGGTGAVEVRRTDSFAYGHGSSERRRLAGGALRIASSCPRSVIGHCSADYRLTVPDNVPVSIHTGGGSVRLAAFHGSADVVTRSGDVNVDAFCGFSLSVTTGSGTARTGLACSPERLELRTASGDVDATVPAGRYRIEADTGSRRKRISGLTATPDAPFEIQAFSGSGSVFIGGTQ